MKGEGVGAPSKPGKGGRAARRGATSRAITSASARRGGRTWPGIARRSARSTTIAGYTRGRLRFTGARPMAWSANSASGGSCSGLWRQGETAVTRPR